MASRGIRIGPGELSILVAAATYGLSTTLSVAALHGVRPADLLAVELAGAAVVQLGAGVATGRLRRHGAARQLLLGALVPGLAYLFADLGLARTSASSGSLLLAVDPLLSVLLAVAFLGERLRARGIVALAVGLAGSAVVALDPGDGGAGADSTAGNLLVLGAVVAGSVFLVATRRYGGDTDGLNASAWQTTGGALATAPFVAIAWTGGGTRLTTAGVGAWAACAGVVICGVVAGVAFNRGIGRVPAARAAQLFNLTPAVGTLTAVALLGERPTPLHLAGGAAILTGLVMLLRNTATPATGEDGRPTDSADPRPPTTSQPLPAPAKAGQPGPATVGAGQPRLATAGAGQPVGAACHPG